ncbi:MAG: hypothetical protein WAU77_11380 [Solirubrobacteraceae bacterium]
MRVAATRELRALVRILARPDCGRPLGLRRTAVAIAGGGPPPDGPTKHIELPSATRRLRSSMICTLDRVTERKAGAVGGDAWDPSRASGLSSP